MSVLNITVQNFEEEVIKSDKPVLLDFYADWCGPCKMVAPIVHAIAEEHPEYKVGKINVDNEGELAVKFRVVSIPTLVVMKDGKVAGAKMGAMPKAQLVAFIDEAIG